MTDSKRTQQEGTSRPKSPQKDEAQRKHSDRTAGTNRDFDESEEARNQGHGHPREERGRHRE
jgi:hypothetical protein